MKLSTLKKQLHEILYIEDEGIIDIILATIISNSIAQSDPVWLMVVGPSSGGKSQLLRPFAVANPDLIHRVDDMTENSFISGMKTEETSILAKIKEKGIILISDFTVIFSKSPETKNAILSQMRMVFDGEYTRHFGNRAPYTWRGHLGIIAGATPSIYHRMAENADMGERFIYYRMKPYDNEKAIQKVKSTNLSAKEMDTIISSTYDEYLKSVMKSYNEDLVTINVHETTNETIASISPFVTQLRTPVHVDYRTGLVDEIPIQEQSFRVFKQLKAIAHALTVMQYHENKKTKLSDDKIKALKWCAYSLGNEERRTAVKAIVDHDASKVTIRDVASYIGLDVDITRRYLSQLTSIGICKMHGKLEGGGNALKYSIQNIAFELLVKEIDTHTQRSTMFDDVTLQDNDDDDEDF